MNRIHIVFNVFAAVVIGLLGVTQVQAQLERTWVSTDGDDTQPCSHQNPCKTFAGAITKTNAGGEIIALDPGGYGPVTITKPITIDGAGVYAGINLTENQNAILIDAHTDDIVVLRGLTLNGRQTPDNFNNYGIKVLKAGSVFVEGCTVSAFGFGFFSQTTAQVFIKDSFLRGNGVGVDPGLGGGTIDHCRIEKNNIGFHLGDGSHRVAIVNSSLSGNQYGVEVLAQSTNTFLAIERCTITGKQPGATFGILAQGDGARIYVSETMVTNTRNGLTSSGAARIISFGNNRLAINGTDGSFTSTKQQQ